MTSDLEADLCLEMSLKHERRQAVVEELQGVLMGDPRRAARALVLAERLAHSPGKSIPQAMMDDAEVDGAYRHLSSEHITPEKILLPHVEKTLARVQEAGLAYAVHDTTECTFGGEKKRSGLGPVNGRDQGFLAHLTLAVSAKGERKPLGLLAVGTRVRKSVGQPTGVESHKWELGIMHSSRGLPTEALIHVADRESDIFALLARCSAENRRFIFRAAQDRAVLTKELGEQTVSRLFAVARAAEPLIQVEADISARRAGGRPPKEIRRFPVRRARTASLAYSAMSIEVKRPAKAKKDEGLPESVKLNIVRAWEPSPPEGEQPIEWILLTSEPIGTQEDVQRIVEGYRTRWLIEEYNKALKSGCAYEQAQLETAHSLLNLFGYCVVIAYVLLLTRALSRAKEQLPASTFFTPAQIACLHALSRRRKVSADPTLEEALLACAGLGGHMKRNGLPGWQTLSRGYALLLEYERGYLLGRRNPSTCAES